MSRFGRKYGKEVTEDQHNRIVDKQVRRSLRKDEGQTLGQLRQRVKVLEAEVQKVRTDNP
jgi:cell division protein FtsB